MYNRLSSLFLPTAQPPCRMKLWVVTMLVASLIGTDQSFSEERCEQPNALGNSFVRRENRLGEFRFKLNPPDYLSAVSVQNHLAFSTVLAKLLNVALPRQTNRLCQTVITATRFPDLSVYLFSGGPAGSSAEDKSVCAPVLQDLIMEVRPTRDTINDIASKEADLKRVLYSNPPGPALEITNHLRLALASIYGRHTVMHALVLADQDYRIFQSFDAGAFLLWLQNQRSVPSDRLIPINICNSEVPPQRSRQNTVEQRVPLSETIPPGPIRVSTKRDRGALARQTPPLKHFVVVGNNQKLGNVPVSTPATDKLCNKQYAIPRERNSGSELASAVTIRCSHEVLYGVDHWIALFCDPNDCRSDSEAEAVMAAIAIDSDVLDLAGGDGEHTRQRGPYLVNVDVSYQ